MAKTISHGWTTAEPDDPTKDVSERNLNDHAEAYSGLTAGHVLRASGATAADFAAIQDADLPSTIARDSEVTSAVAALSTVYQPLDSDLSSIAALTTTSFGRGLLSLADAAALVANHSHGAGGSDLVQVASGAGSVVIPGIEVPDRVPASPNSDDQEFDSALSGWTTRGTLDTSDANSTFKSHLYLARTANATRINGIDRSFSSARPKTITAKFSACSGNEAYHNIFMYLTDGTKYMTWGVVNQVASGIMERNFWSSDTNRSGQTDSGAEQFWTFSGPFYLRLVLTSDSDIACYFSYNGMIWMPFQLAQNPTMTCSNFGIGINDFAGNKKVEVAVDWIRLT